MKCARCNAALDDGAMLCTHCGAVVGMKYASGSTPPAPAFSGSSVFSPVLAATTVTPARSLHARVRGLLFEPRAEWRAIAAAPPSAADLWWRYVLPLAVLAPLALLVAQAAFGITTSDVNARAGALPMLIAAALLTLLIDLVRVAFLAWSVNAMALKFGAIPDRTAALAVIAYAMTPIWIAGALYVFPALGMVSALAAAYAFVLVILGLQALMRCAALHALAYAFATLGIAFVLWIGTSLVVPLLLAWLPLPPD